MGKVKSKIQELENALSNFMHSIELVFDNDWDMTETCIKDSQFLIGKDGTF